MAVHWGGRGPGHMSRSIGGQVFDYYVDPVSGSDVAAGTLSAPLATLSRAVTLIGASTGKRIGLKRGTTLRNDPVTFNSASTYLAPYGAGAAPNHFGSSQTAVSSFTKVGNLYSIAATVNPFTLALVDGSGNATKLYMASTSNGNSAVDPATEGEWTFFPGTHATPNLLKFYTTATITGYQVEIPQSGAARNGIILTGNGCQVSGVVSNYWTGAGMEMQGDSQVIAGCTANYNGGDGIDATSGADSFVLSGSTMNYNGQRKGAGNGPGDGFSGHSGAGIGSNGIITGCTFIGNTQTGVGNQSGCQITTQFCYFRDNFYDFNVYNVADALVGSHNCYYGVFVRTSASPATSGGFLNSNGSSGVANEATAVRIRNCSFYSSGWTATSASTLQGFTWTVDSNAIKIASGITNTFQIVSATIVNSTNNISNGQTTAMWRAGPFIAPTTETGALTTDPMFTNPASGDFTLQAGSPCINAGTNWGQTQDYTGKAITGTPDRGAHER